MIIRFNCARNRFEAESTYAERNEANPLLKGAGFAFDFNGAKVWHTAGYKATAKPIAEQKAIAAKLAQYLDADAAALVGADLAQQVQAAAAKVQTALEASRATDAVIDVPRPEGLEYLPYQRAGIAYAMSRPNVLIADEMGLGKTIQAIGINNADSNVRSILIVCPASLKLNWRREFTKWDTKGLTVGIADSKSLPAADVVIVNYDILTKLSQQLRARKWDLLVADECHKAKNPRAQRTIELLGKRTWQPEHRAWHIDVEPIRATRRVFLTGTPIVNRPSELWPFVLALDPEGLGKYKSKYETRYCGAHQTRFGWDKTGATNLGELQERLRSTFMIRRLKSEVLKDLPAKVRQVVVLEATEDMEELLRREEVAFADVDLDEGENTPAFSELSAIRKEVAIAKIPLALAHVDSLLEDGGKSKIVIMAHHHEVMDAIRAHYGNRCVVVDGRTPIVERQANVDRFQTDPTCEVFAGSIQAAGVGLTLTAADTVVFFELDWVPGNVTQAEDRCHRIGQKNTVLVLHIVLDGSVDANIVGKIISKQAVIDAALDNKATQREMPKVEPAGQTREQKRATELVEAKLTEANVAAIHTALRKLAKVCDGALSDDDHGFNGGDARFGHQLAAQATLSPKQAQYAQKMIKKYHRQLGEEILLAAGCKPLEAL